jgi:hypothetical protein
LRVLRRAGTGIQLPNVVEVVRSRPHGHVVAVLDTMRHLGLGRLIVATLNRLRCFVVVMVVARLLEVGFDNDASTIKTQLLTLVENRHNKSCWSWCRALDLRSYCCNRSFLLQ